MRGKLVLIKYVEVFPIFAFYFIYNDQMFDKSIDIIITSHIYTPWNKR